jgi:hypothetical protein
VKRPAEYLGERFHRERLRKSGDTFEKEVSSGEKADENALEHVLLSHDDSLQLEQCTLELGRFGSRLADQGRLVLGHGSLLSTGRVSQ